MFPELPALEKTKLKQAFDAPTASRLAKLDGLLLLLPEPARKSAWPKFTHSPTLQKRYRGNRERPAQWLTQIPDSDAAPLAIGFVDPAADAFTRLTLARKLVQRLGNPGGRIGILAPGFSPAVAATLAEACVAALEAAGFTLPAAKQKSEPRNRTTSIEILGLGARVDLKRCQAAALGNNLARWLTILPGNALTPASYARRVRKLAREQGWKYEFFDEAQLKRLGAGAFLAVSQASPARDAGIVRLRYTPARGARRKPVTLVGKGICYDTGGTNLKPAGGMFGMHGDMQGSAVALGTFLALSELKVGFPVECWLALAQNHIGPKAYKQNDVVRASNGMHIEVVHTDAEGRMVLADTLALAGKRKPALIVDYATLTGSCVQSLGTRYSGAFTNDMQLREPIIAAGRSSGERVWPFPNDTDYDSELDSEIADIKQCLIPGEADHILASRFLNRFVDKSIPWIHVDLSAGEHKGGLAHVPSEVTGFGVRYTLDLLLDQKPETRQ